MKKFNYNNDASYPDPASSKPSTSLGNCFFPDSRSPWKSEAGVNSVPSTSKEKKDAEKKINEKISLVMLWEH